MTDSTSPAAPAGWFPAGVEGQERYWDGTAWTDQVRPVGTVVSESPTTVETSTASAPGKKPRNVLGIVALAVAAVGFIFACIPGALIVGWLLLPVGFILGIVALLQKGKPKWQGVAAIIVSVVGTIIGVIVFIAVVAGAVNNAVGDTVTDEVGSSAVGEGTSASDAPAAEE